MKIITFVALFALTAAAVCEAFECPHYNVSTFYDTSRNAAGLQHTIDTFRAELGGQDNGNSPGPLAHGHRSVSCDCTMQPVLSTLTILAFLTYFLPFSPCRSLTD